MSGLIVSAHRGVSSLAPENTLAAIRLAGELRVPWVELDAQLAGDDTVIVFHDERLERCSDSRGPVWRQPYSALARLDAGAWFAPGFAGERIPRLADVLDLARRQGLSLNIEIKLSREDWRERQVDAIASVIRGAGLPADRLLLSSFDRRALELAARAVPEVPRGLICERIPRDIGRIVEALGLATVNVGQEGLTADDVARARAAGAAVHVWTVNDPEAAPGLRALGVAGIISDRPQDILAMGA